MGGRLIVPTLPEIDPCSGPVGGVLKPRPKWISLQYLILFIKWSVLNLLVLNAALMGFILWQIMYEVKAWISVRNLGHTLESIQVHQKMTQIRMQFHLKIFFRMKGHLKEWQKYILIYNAQNLDKLNYNKTEYIPTVGTFWINLMQVEVKTSTWYNQKSILTTYGRHKSWTWNNFWTFKGSIYLWNNVQLNYRNLH